MLLSYKNFKKKYINVELMACWIALKIHDFFQNLPKESFHDKNLQQEISLTKKTIILKRNTMC